MLLHWKCRVLTWPAKEVAAVSFSCVSLGSSPWFPPLLSSLEAALLIFLCLGFLVELRRQAGMRLALSSKSWIRYPTQGPTDGSQLAGSVCSMSKQMNLECVNEEWHILEYKTKTHNNMRPLLSHNDNTSNADDNPMGRAELMSDGRDTREACSPPGASGFQPGFPLFGVCAPYPAGKMPPSDSKGRRVPHPGSLRTSDCSFARAS